MIGVATALVEELPPRARRIRLPYWNLPDLPGTTSACAENTAERAPNPNQKWNYLRVRGEYLIRGSSHQHPTELPPRARRIRISSVMGCVNCGTTSACAENTVGGCLGLGQFRNYLRVRGEYGFQSAERFDHRELPPRARRILSINTCLSTYIGTTSACAENTPRRLLAQQRQRNYLRVRGEYFTAHMEECK